LLWEKDEDGGERMVVRVRVSSGLKLVGSGLWDRTTCDMDSIPFSGIHETEAHAGH